MAIGRTVKPLLAAPSRAAWTYVDILDEAKRAVDPAVLLEVLIVVA